MKMTVIFSAVLGVIGLAGSPASAQVLVNGSFTDELTYWNTNGNVVAVHTPVNNNRYARLAETLGGEREPQGGRSSIYQVFNIPSGVAEISFRYRLISGPPDRTSTVPPDSFTAFLLNTNGIARVLPPAPGDAPTFSQGFFYADSDGAVVYDMTSNSVVSVDPEPASDGLTTVRLDVSSIVGAGEAVRLEFGLASADNGVTSFAVVDGVVGSGAPSFCVFRDDFNRPDDNTLGFPDVPASTSIAWYEQEEQDNPASVSIVNNALSLSDDNNTAPNDTEEAWAIYQAVDVSGIDSPFIRFSWAPRSISDNDEFRVDWSDPADHVWKEIDYIDMSSNGTLGTFETRSYDLLLPSINTIQIRLWTQTTQDVEGALVDFVEVCGTPPVGP